MGRIWPKAIAVKSGSQGGPFDFRCGFQHQGPQAGAASVQHFEQVAAREIVANPNFYRSRMRFGLIGAPILFAVAALGFVLGPGDVSNGDVSIPSLMVIIGMVAGGAMLVLSLAAWLLDRAQARKR